ncbi:MAG TPA: putative metalloprotease CJM1_0395 family protein [Marinobacter sp.]|nr:putative metalloprotease CJM1_0395 family protein [Marinobacter sp.]
MNALSSLPSASLYVNTPVGHPAKEPSEGSGTPVRRSSAPDQGLSAEDLKKLTELKARDREVRAHEAAHQAAGGQHAGAMSLTYERGPDGAQYAVGGEVPIDVSPIAEDPQATIEKMRTVRAAALAPAEPSSQDRAVAAQAMQTILQAQAELSADKNSGKDSAAKIKGNTEESTENRVQSLASRQANDTYRSVSGLTGEPDSQQSGFLNVLV